MITDPPPIPSIPLPDWDALQRKPIRECGERLQPAGLCPLWHTWPAYYHQGITGALPECYLRLHVFERLLQAARSLPEQFQLVLLDGWRPFTVQQYLYDTLLNLMQHAHPEQPAEQLALETRKLIAPPSVDAAAPSPHLTGGSVDVTLADRNGELVDMGTLFDEASPLSYAAALEDEERHHSTHDLSARHHRRVLYQAMTGAGFTNLPSEWWHFDYGNQLWAWYSGAEHALYGATQPPSLEQLWRAQLAR